MTDRRRPLGAFQVLAPATAESLILGAVLAIILFGIVPDIVHAVIALKDEQPTRESLTA